MFPEIVLPVESGPVRAPRRRAGRGFRKRRAGATSSGVLSYSSVQKRLKELSEIRGEYYDRIVRGHNELQRIKAAKEHGAAAAAGGGAAADGSAEAGSGGREADGSGGGVAGGEGGGTAADGGGGGEAG